MSYLQDSINASIILDCLSAVHIFLFRANTMVNKHGATHVHINYALLPCNHKQSGYEQVCELNIPTLHFVPANARQGAFARALSSALRGVILCNTEEAWLKLFMLPKCVHPSLHLNVSHLELCITLQYVDEHNDLWAISNNSIKEDVHVHERRCPCILRTFCPTFILKNKTLIFFSTTAVWGCL